MLLTFGDFITELSNSENLFSVTPRDKLSKRMITYYNTLRKNLKIQGDGVGYFVHYENRNWSSDLREFQHYYHHEIFNMPKEGWKLVYPFSECGCRYYKKHGYCVHIQYAKDYYSSLDVGTMERSRLPGRPRVMAAAWVVDNS